jgi:hypothetical protein
MENWCGDAALSSLPFMPFSSVLYVHIHQKAHIVDIKLKQKINNNIHIYTE